MSPSHLDRSFAAMLGRRAGVDDPAVLAAAALASHAVSGGHSCLDLARADVLAPDVALPDPDAWREALLACPGVVRSAGEPRVSPLVLDGSRLYLDRFYRYEQRLAAQMRTRAHAECESPHPDTLQTLADLFSSAEHQERPRAAAERVLRHRLAVVCGGPGTGKTTVVVKMLALIRAEALHTGQQAPTVALLAPTGKAAARLAESVRRSAKGLPPHLAQGLPDQAQTIHAALGVIRGTPRFRRHAQAPLSADVLVVDEASMVALPLMCKLMEAVRPDARVVLLGDADQLVSVELGSVLGDITAASGPVGASVVRLTHTWRYPANSGIQAMAQAIVGGDGEALLEALADPKLSDVTQLPAAGRAERLGQIQDAVQAGYGPLAEAADVPSAVAALGRYRLLCAHRHGAWGVERLNPLVEGWLADALPEGRRALMVTKNDRQLALNNGDVGVVDVADGLAQAWFETATGHRSVPVAMLPAHASLYATTVHKSQGSEYDQVTLLLPPEASPVVTRELLYTAVTRATKRVTVLGQASVISAGVERQVKRMSGLRGALEG
jgi:exodeoxyribonuclease V alpha subunit